MEGGAELGVVWAVESAAGFEPLDVVLGDVAQGLALVFTKGHASGGFGLSEEFEHFLDGKIVDHLGKDAVEDHDVIEGAVGLVGRNAVDFSQDLERVAR